MHQTVYIANTNIEGMEYITSVKRQKFPYIPKKRYDEMENKPHVVGFTKFKKPKKDSAEVLIGRNIYGVENFVSEDGVDGYIILTDGNCLAFDYGNEAIVPIISKGIGCLFLLMIAAMVLLGPKESPKDTIFNWVIEDGIDGTDVQLAPEEELSYNTYWGYQSVTIDKNTKVPFVNSEKNTSYAKFTLFNKEGEVIYKSDLVKPDSYIEWDAYSYYGGKTGSKLHDLTVTFYSPVTNENGEIIDFEVSMFAANTPDFEIIIK